MGRGSVVLVPGVLQGWRTQEKQSHRDPHFLLLLITVSRGGVVGGICVVFRTPPGGQGFKVKCCGLKAIKDSPLHVLKGRN